MPRRSSSGRSEGAADHRFVRALGLGYTFQSGAYEAWIADEVGGERLTRVLLRGAQASWIGALAGVGVSTAVASFDLRAAIVTGGLTSS